jgi:molybdopterin-binding protein
VATEFRSGDIAELLGVSADTVRRLVDGGRLPSRRNAAGQRIVDGRDLAVFLVENAAEPVSHLGIVASARNRFRGVVTSVERDGVAAVVHVQAGPHRLTSLMTREAADALGIEPGDVAVASVKATNVVIEVAETP